MSQPSVRLGMLALVVWCTIAYLGLPATLTKAGQSQKAATGDGLIKRVERLEALVAKLKLNEAACTETNPGNGYLQIGDLLICWGRVDLRPGENAPHVRPFSFPFPVEFEAPPAVTTGIHLVSSGHVFGVYYSKLTSTGYSGRAFDNKSASDKALATIPVTMSYVAIGRPKK